MRLRIAQYTSPKKGPVGYRWNFHNPEIAVSKLDQLRKYIDDIFPSDGRDIEKQDLQGGFLFIPNMPDGVVFRFLDGGQDAKGRSGKVTLNCAFFDIADCKGKTLAGIFTEKIMTDLTEERIDTTAVFNARDSYKLVNNSDYAVTNKTKRIGQSEIDKIYQVCTIEMPMPMLVEVKSTKAEKYVELSPISRPQEDIENPFLPSVTEKNHKTTLKPPRDSLIGKILYNSLNKIKLKIIPSLLAFIIGVLVTLGGIVTLGLVVVINYKVENGEPQKAITDKITDNDNTYIYQLWGKIIIFYNGDKADSKPDTSRDDKTKKLGTK
jgi:hypothetical protein